MYRAAGFDLAWLQTASEGDNLVQFGGEMATWLLVGVAVRNERVYVCGGGGEGGSAAQPAGGRGLPALPV